MLYNICVVKQGGSSEGEKLPNIIMISYIKGKVTAAKSEYAVIECNNIGFKVYMPFSQSSALPGGEVTVYTYMYIREGIMDLYGFSGEESLELFEILIGVSGVGSESGDRYARYAFAVGDNIVDYVGRF